MLTHYIKAVLKKGPGLRAPCHFEKQDKLLPSQGIFGFLSLELNDVSDFFFLLIGELVDQLRKVNFSA
jgi:hypothetical protein